MRFGQAGLRSLLVVSALVALAIPAVQALAQESEILDGRTFAGEKGKKGKEKGDKEQLVFVHGMFDPKGCHKSGFFATPYVASQDGEVITFVADHSNTKGDRMLWEGKVEGDAISGKMTYWEGNKEPQEYWFRGKASP